MMQFLFFQIVGSLSIPFLGGRVRLSQIDWLKT